MKIELLGHDYKYEIWQTVNIFFPRAVIIYGEASNEDKMSVAIRSELKQDNEGIKVYSEIFRSGKCETDNREAMFDVTTDVRATKRLLKFSLYTAIQKLLKISPPWGAMTGIRPAKIAREMLQSGFNEQEIKEYYKSEYFASDKKIALAYTVAKNEKKIIDNMMDKGISIYIGIPFCPSRCAYCSFYSASIDKYACLVAPYIEALFKEIEFVSKLLQDMSRVVETIYIGGGTPTSLSAAELEKLLSKIHSAFDLKHLKEFTIEAGRPDSITFDKLTIMKKFNTGRISINPQSMNDNTLLKIGRGHTSQDIIDSFKLARLFKFNNINCDIIAGLPDEDLQMFGYTIDSIIKLRPENITVHTMSIKKASLINEKFNDYNINDSVVNEMLAVSQEKLIDSSYVPYYLYRQKNILGNLENVGWCQKGYEGIYNIYIMEETQSIISLGAGGVTKIVDRETNKIERIFNVKTAKEYIERIDEMIDRKRILYKKG